MKKILVLSLLAVSAASNAVVVWGAGFSIPDGNAGGASSTINLGVGGTLNGIILEGLTHTWVGDLTANVSGIGSLFQRIGRVTTGDGDSSNFLGDYRFENGSANDIWAEAALGTSTYNLRPGTYRPSGVGSGAEVPMTTALSAGNYTLTIADLVSIDTGSVGRWGIDYNPVPEPATMAVLGLGALAAIRRRRAR